MPKRFNIGLLTATITDVFSNRFAKGAMEAAKEFDINMVIFPGKYVGLQHKYLQYDTQYEYQYNVLFSHAAEAKLDYLIVPVGTIAYAYDNERKKCFLDSLGDTPILCVAAEIEGYDYLQFDNVAGITAAVNHLAKIGRKHIGIMAGELNNLDCIQRYNAYRAALKNNGLDFKESYVMPGTLTEECENEARQLVEQNPELDAVICANDIIAAVLYDVLKEKGKTIGKDISVVGFDDLPIASKLEPPMASVRADAWQLGKRAVEKAVHFLNGIKDDSHYLDTEFILRASARNQHDTEISPAKGFSESQYAELCAKVPDISERYEIMKAYFSKVHERYFEEKEAVIKNAEKYAERSHIDNIFIRDALMFGGNLMNSYAKIMKRLCNVGAITGFIYTLEQPIEHNYGDTFPNNLKWCFKSYSYDADVFTNEKPNQLISTPEVFDNDKLRTDRQHIFIAADLYTAQTQYGLALLEPQNADFFDELELVSYQLSSAVRTLHILKQQELLLNEIHEKNLALEQMSKIDELTKVYNRRGFFLAAEELIHKFPGESFFVCFADMDGLKTVNDIYGHAEGDFSIKLAAECLVHMFGENAVVGRMGGDEMAAITLKSDSTSVESLRRRKDDFVANFNDSHQKPYKFDLSLGIVESVCGNSYDLKAAIDKTDDLLYIEKNEKKQHR